jgi:hypothetical protein
MIYAMPTSWEWTKSNEKNMMKLNTSTHAFMKWSWMHWSYQYGLGIHGVYVNSFIVNEGVMSKQVPYKVEGRIILIGVHQINYGYLMPFFLKISDYFHIIKVFVAFSPC